jgi:Tfp pilus assembly protein PilZ
MKRVLIGDNREELVTTLESLLKNWGYRAIATADPETFLEINRELKPDLLIIGPALLADKKIVTQIEKLTTPTIYIQQPESAPDWQPKGETLSYPVDIFKLFSFVQGHLEKIPRRNIRLDVRMPGLYYKNDEVCIAEVLSLSPEGLFLKTGSKIEKIDNIRLILPLIGMQTELEIMGRIVYRVEPTPDNNYMQGMGIEFTDIDAETVHILEHYVEGLLFNELNERQYSKNSLNTDHLRKHSNEPILQLTPIT